jgi:hypothetical protein
MTQPGACACCVWMYHVSLSAEGLLCHATGCQVPIRWGSELCRASGLAKALDVLVVYPSFRHNVSALNWQARFIHPTRSCCTVGGALIQEPDICALYACWMPCVHLRARM